MAQSFQTTSGNLIIPDAYPSITVQASPGGLAASGVIALVGEADQGPDYTIEGLNLKSNLFGPDQGAEVAAKYKSGNLVDAFNAVVSAANDPQLTGAPSRVLLVKTNPSTRATSNLPKIGGGTYGTLNDLSYGKLGNLIYWNTSTKTQETVPTTGSFHIAVPAGNVDVAFRVNGAAKVSATINAGTLPAAIQSALNGLTGLSCTGGVDRAMINAVAGSLTVTGASGNSIVVTFSGGGGAWNVTPTVGDMVVISATSAIKGAADANCGSYIVTAATATTVSITKIANLTGIGTITAPVNVAIQAVASTTADIRAYSPLVVTLTSAAATNSSNRGSAIDGVGKTIEFEDPETNVSGEKLSNLAYNATATVAKVGFLSTPAAPYVIVSAQEYSVNLTVSRQVDNTSEVLSAGGQIALQMSYVGTTATVSINATTLTTTVVGGSGSNLSITLRDYPTISDLVAYINAQTGYSAKVGNTLLGQMSSLALDEVTSMGICTDYNQGALAYSALNGRVKVDAAKFWQAIATGSSAVKLNSDPSPNPTNQAGTPSGCGLPDAQIGAVTVAASPVYLSGGAKGGTTQAVFSAAIDALQGVVCNFVVPLFSADASADILAGLTEASSTYTIDAINAYVKTHVNAMSTLKRRRNRQAFLSKQSTFTLAREAAANLAAYRCSLTFQDVKRVTAAAGIVQFQPWMLAVLAAGMQAAGQHRGILKKGINCSGVLQAAGDFNDQLDTNMEDALSSGLLPAKIPEDGAGFVWASDQTTYGKDNNFVYNSIQAVYVADLIALTTAQRMSKMFVGQSVAEISATLAVTALESVMDDLRRLKLIAPSDDAPRGFKNARIKISGTAMIVSIEVKLAGLIYFVPISFLVTPVEQSA